MGHITEVHGHEYDVVTSSFSFSVYIVSVLNALRNFSQVGGQPSLPLERIREHYVTIHLPKSTTTRHWCSVDALELSDPMLLMYLT